MLAFQQRNFGVEIRAINFPQRSNANAALKVGQRCEVGHSR